MMAKVRSVPPN
ncbi:hypothetical protein LINPERPRIM_LOCUS21907 [Linum perenne]